MVSTDRHRAGSPAGTPTSWCSRRATPPRWSARCGSRSTPTSTCRCGCRSSPRAPTSPAFEVAFTAGQLRPAGRRAVRVQPAAGHQGRPRRSASRRRQRRRAGQAPAERKPAGTPTARRRSSARAGPRSLVAKLPAGRGRPAAPEARPATRRPRASCPRSAAPGAAAGCSPARCSASCSPTTAGSWPARSPRSGCTRPRRADEVTTAARGRQHGADQAVRPPGRGRRRRPGGPARRGLRLPRPQRLGQDHHDPDAARPDPAHRRRARAARRADAGRAPAPVLPRVGALVEGPAFHPYLSGPGQPAPAGRGRPHRRPAHRARPAIDAALDRVGLLAAAGKRYRAYSLGMRQRLALAAALLTPRELLILDEPTNGLDPQGTREVRALISGAGRRRARRCCCPRTCSSEVEQICTHVGVMHLGKLVAQAPLAELRAQAAPRVRVETDRPGRRRPGAARAGPHRRRRRAADAATGLLGRRRAGEGRGRAGARRRAGARVRASSRPTWRTCSCR